MMMKFSLANGGVVISQPPYSPDLAQADLLLFLEVKTSFKGSIMQDTGGHQAKRDHRIKLSSHA
jgi:hypothetical protein